MSKNETYDLVVIGGGPAGYAASIRAGQLGKKVACIEMERAGGTCLNWGCIPSKALLKSAELYLQMQKAGELGLSCEKPGYDFEKIIERSRDVSANMAKGIEFLFRKNKVEYIVGTGQANVPGMVEVTDGKEKGRYLKTENILLATGCRARKLPDLEIDGKRTFTSREALALKKQPKSIIIIGAGAIGAEFAFFYNAFGTKVTLVEMLPNILPVEDHESSKLLERSFKKQGIDTRTSTSAENIKVTKKGVSCELVSGDKK